MAKGQTHSIYLRTSVHPGRTRDKWTMMGFSVRDGQVCVLHTGFQCFAIIHLPNLGVFTHEDHS